jgi:hypothetical protein
VAFSGHDGLGYDAFGTIRLEEPKLWGDFTGKEVRNTFLTEVAEAAT